MRPNPLIPILVMFYVCVFECVRRGKIIKGSSLGKVNDLHAAKPCVDRGLVQLEVDIHGVSPPFAEVGGRSVDAHHAAGRGQNTFVHHHIAGGADNGEIVDLAIRADGDAEGGGELRGADNARRLIPDPEEAVVDQFMIPAEVAGSGGRRGAAGGFGLAHGRSGGRDS